MKKIYCSNFGDETKTFFKGTLFQIHPPVLKDNSDWKLQNPPLYNNGKEQKGYGKAKR